MAWKAVKFKDGLEGVEAAFPGYEVIAHRVGNQTDAIANNNKYFSAELLKLKNGQWLVMCHYGRVGDNGVLDYYGPSDEQDMRSEYESKCKEKIREKKYKEIKFVKPTVGTLKAREKSWGVDSAEVPADKKKKITESKDPKTPAVVLHSTVERLIEQWFADSSNAIQSNSAIEITSEGLKTPLGILTFAQIAKGRDVLGDLTKAIKKKDDDQIKILTSAFYSHIPTKLGRKILDSDLLSTLEIVDTKFDLLQMMDDALEVGGSSYVSGAAVKYQELGVQLSYLEKTDPEWIRLDKKVQATKGNSHYVNTKVKNILKVVIPSERARFEACKLGTPAELWHGSRNSNIVGILKSGLKIAPPEAPMTGYAFGKGLYAASHSTKSLNYSVLSFPNQRNTTNCFLFVLDAKLGKQLIKPYGDGGEREEARRGGFDSTWGKPGHGGSYRSLAFDEFIVYTVDQYSIKYIIEVER